MASGDAFQAELLSLQLALVEIGTEEETLRRASELLTPQLFDDVVEDRLIARVCGYPSCRKHLEVERAPRCGLHPTGWTRRPGRTCSCCRLPRASESAISSATSRPSYCSQWCFKVSVSSACALYCFAHTRQRSRQQAARFFRGQLSSIQPIMRLKTRKQYTAELLCRDPADNLPATAPEVPPAADAGLPSSPLAGVASAVSISVTERDASIPLAPAPRQSDPPVRPSRVITSPATRSTRAAAPCASPASVTLTPTELPDDLLDLSAERRRLQADREKRRRARVAAAGGGASVRRQTGEQRQAAVPDDPAAVHPYAAARGSHGSRPSDVPTDTSNDGDADDADALALLDALAFVSPPVMAPRSAWSAPAMSTRPSASRVPPRHIAAASASVDASASIQTALPRSDGVASRGSEEDGDSDGRATGLAPSSDGLRPTGDKARDSVLPSSAKSAPPPLVPATAPVARGILKSHGRQAEGARDHRTRRRVQWRPHLDSDDAAVAARNDSASSRALSAAGAPASVLQWGEAAPSANLPRSDAMSAECPVSPAPRMVANEPPSLPEPQPAPPAPHPDAPRAASAGSLGSRAHATGGRGDADGGGSDSEADSWDSGTDTDDGEGNIGGLWFNDAVDVAGGVRSDTDASSAAPVAPSVAAAASQGSLADLIRGVRLENSLGIPAESESAGADSIVSSAFSSADVLGIGRIEAVAPPAEDGLETPLDAAAAVPVSATPAPASTDGTLLQPASTAPAISAPTSLLHRTFGMNAFGRLWASLAGWRSDETDLVLARTVTSTGQLPSHRAVSESARASAARETGAAPQATAAVASGSDNAAIALVTSRRELLLWNLQRAREWLAQLRLRRSADGAGSGAASLPPEDASISQVTALAEAATEAVELFVHSFDVREPVPLLPEAHWRALALVAVAAWSDAARPPGSTSAPPDADVAAAAADVDAQERLIDLLAFRAAPLVAPPPLPAARGAARPAALTTAELEAAASLPTPQAPDEEPIDDSLSAEDLALLEALLLRGPGGAGAFVRPARGGEAAADKPPGGRRRAGAGAAAEDEAELLRQARRDLVVAARRMAGQPGVPTVL